MFDFDRTISRRGTQAEKYTALKHLFGREDLLPFWVADMEFAAAPSITKALAERVDHPVYGYTARPASLIDSIRLWNERRYNLTVANESVTLIPGVMSGVSAAVLALSDPGDSIVVQLPVYPPLMKTVTRNERILVENHLVVENGQYRIDFNSLERQLQIHRPKIMLLCSPHNPVGRVWSGQELARIVELANQYDFLLVSDEIHADIVFPPHVHISALALDAQAASRIVVLNSASKSFNIAGLDTAYALIPDRRLRTSFRQQLRGMNLHGVNLFGMTALEAAYSGGEDWLKELLLYLRANRDFLTETLQGELPGLAYFVPEGTYLCWLDFNSLGLDAGRIRKTLIDGARVGLNDGITFSRAADGFWRFNFAVPRSMLEEGLARIVDNFR